MSNFKKVIRPGKTKIGNKLYSVYCEIEYTEGRLSITGVEGPFKNGNAAGGCGQIDMGINEIGVDSYIEKYAIGWNKEMMEKFFDVWKNWHLNDLQAGCEHQREMEWGKEEDIGKPCPVCGYKYGTAWLRKEVPEDVLEFLQNLPETDKTPAWV